MTRVPKTRTRLKKKRPTEAIFDAAPGSRLLASRLCAVLTVMLLIHQTQIEGLAVLLRLFIAVMTAFFAVLTWYFHRRGSRRGTVLRVGREGFGIAVGFAGWLDIPWDEVKAFRYWEPTGMAMLIKRRQSRWVGVLLNRNLPASGLSWDMRFEIWLNTFHNRPGLCLLDPFVRAPILDVLQAFMDYAPKALDDNKWMAK